MAKSKGYEILKNINHSIEINKIDKDEKRSFYELADEIMSKDAFIGRFVSHSYLYPYIISKCKDVDVFLEDFYKYNFKLAKTFSKIDLQNQIFIFLAEHKGEVTEKVYTELLKKLNSFKVCNVVLVSMFSGIRLEKEEVFGNFKFKLLDYDEIEQVYGKNTMFIYAVDKNVEKEYRKKQKYTFLEYHNNKIRITSDGSVISSSNYIDTLANAYKEKFTLLSLVFNFLNGQHQHIKVSKWHSEPLHMSLNNIFISPLENSIYIYEDLSNPTLNKGGLMIDNVPTHLYLRKKSFGDGIISSKIDEELILLIDKEKEGLEKNIFQAILWAGKSIRTLDAEEAFVQLFIALEALSFGKSISDFVAYYLGENIDERIKYKDIIDNLHNKRSRIVHQNSFANTINNHDYYMLFDIIKKIVYKMYNNLSSVKLQEDMEFHIKTLKYS